MPDSVMVACDFDSYGPGSNPGRATISRKTFDDEDFNRYGTSRVG